MTPMVHSSCRIAWIPALQVHQIVCNECGAVVCDDVEQLTDFPWPGDCNPGQTLGIHIKEKIKLRDQFGPIPKE